MECALWPQLYFRTSLCESVLEGQDNRASGNISYMHKVLSPVVDFAINYDILQYQYDHWLFKTITGAVNASKASGCSPNRSLENKSFSKTFWQHQHLFLIDAVHQYGFPSLFITISPYEWTFPFPPFIDDIRNTYLTEVAVLETLHIAHVLEQLVRGYLTGGNSNRWRTHVLSNVHDPAAKNVRTFFYCFEFQQRGTLHLHMLVWLEDVSCIRADLKNASLWRTPKSQINLLYLSIILLMCSLLMRTETPPSSSSTQKMTPNGIYVHILLLFWGPSSAALMYSWQTAKQCYSSM